ERYAAVQRDVSLAERLGRHAAMLIDLGALDGAHGKAEMKTARRLVLEGLAHAAASDIHRPEDQTSIAAGMAWIRKQLGADALDEMLAGNPRRLLTGEMPEPPRRAGRRGRVGASSSTRRCRWAWGRCASPSP